LKFEFILPELSVYVNEKFQYLMIEDFKRYRSIRAMAFLWSLFSLAHLSPWLTFPAMDPGEVFYILIARACGALKLDAFSEP
jgi:hypothetical protein